MKRLFYILLFTCSISITGLAQETVYPAPPQTQTIALTNATVHIGNGQVIENGMVVFSAGKIVDVRATVPVTAEKIIDCKGKHIYPGLILSASDLGLVEVRPVRATSDVSEIGEYNTNIRSLVAYNTDSKVINTLRMNGILQANIVPKGAVISGSSSVVQLDAWNWEDAVVREDNGIHFNMPTLLSRPDRRGSMSSSPADPSKTALEQIEKAKAFFREAKAYLTQSHHEETNLKYEAVKGLFNRKQKFFIHCNIVKEMLLAIDFVKEFGFDVVIVGGVDSYLIAELLKQNNIAVILNQMHSLPTMIDDDIDQPFKTPAVLQKAGVLFAINDIDANTRQRNLAFNAGTAAAYGLSREEALSAVTLNAARILGVADRTGSLEPGKDATILVSEGDLLDMRTNILVYAFIQGRQIELNDRQKQLYERYLHKYELK